MPNADMAEFWNGDAAEVWAREAERFDSMLGPIGRRLLSSALLEPGDRVLDVGCGNGATSLATARIVAGVGSVTGVDLSAPMLEVARRRAEHQGVDVSFRRGDAQTAVFHDPFDVVLSRFGVMFFDDPEAAFANLAKAVRPGGRMFFVCWKEMAANEWIAVPSMAMVDHVGIPELPEPGTPGPFAFADAERTRELLGAAGWSGVTIEERRDPIRMGSDPEDVVAFLFSHGMGRGLVEDKDPGTVEAGTAAALEALRPYVTSEGVVLEGAYWLVTATKE